MLYTHIDYMYYTYTIYIYFLYTTHTHTHTHTHTLFTECPLARHCLGTMDTAENKISKIPVPEKLPQGLGVHEQENTHQLPMVPSAADVWERREQPGRSLGKWHLS